MGKHKQNWLLVSVLHNLLPVRQAQGPDSFARAHQPKALHNCLPESHCGTEVVIQHNPFWQRYLCSRRRHKYHTHVEFEDAMGREGWTAMDSRLAGSNQLDYQEGEKY